MIFNFVLMLNTFITFLDRIQGVSLASSETNGHIASLDIH